MTRLLGMFFTTGLVMFVVGGIFHLLIPVFAPSIETEYTGDIERHRPIVGFLGLAFALMGVVLIGVDFMAGMPTWWTAIEGPRGLVVGLLIYFLAGSGEKKP